MSLDLSKLIEVLGEKGHTPKEIAEIVRLCTCDVPAYAVEATALNARQLRNHRHYEAKKRLKASEKASEQDAKTSEASESVLIASETSEIKTPLAPAHTRGDNNLSRLVDTSSAAAVVAEAREPISDWPAGDANQHAKLLAQMAGTSRLDPARQPGLATTAGRLAAWKRDGASWTYDVVPAVTIMSQKRGPPIATWKYFDPAIAQSIADNRRALQIPTAANGHRHERPDQPSAKFTAKQANLDRSFRAAQRVAARGPVV